MIAVHTHASERELKRTLGLIAGLLLLGGCGEDSTQNTEDAALSDALEDTADGTDPPNADARFLAGAMPESLHVGGYIDSIFINKAGDRIYFVHSILSPSVLDGSATVEQCSHVQAPLLEGHVTIENLEWNSDLYQVIWDGEQWSEPINLGASINTLGMECCMWLNDDETEIIFYTKTDLDKDGVDGDVGLPPTGNYRATRAHRDAPWSAAEPLPGDYGIDNQIGDERHDVHKAPSGNLYLWEKFSNLDQLLRFGERIGGTYEEPVYAPPATLEGSVNHETQIWVNDAETQMVFNRRTGDGESEAHLRTRSTTDAPWGAPTLIPTTGFEDVNGKSIWGEPTFDQSESFMIFIRFNSSDPDCLTPDVMHAPGTPESGFQTPTVLN